jgi:hypothetical protein
MISTSYGAYFQFALFKHDQSAPAWSLPRLCGFITADTAGRLLLLLVEHLLHVESDVSVATNIVVTHLRMSIGIRNAT